jgi:hypothetical protein
VLRGGLSCLGPADEGCAEAALMLQHLCPSLVLEFPGSIQIVLLHSSLRTACFSCCPACHRPYLPGLMSVVLEHLGSSLTTAFTRLPVGVVGTTPTQASAAAAATLAGGGAAGGCPIEALGQYFMDLVYLEAALGKAGVMGGGGSCSGMGGWGGWVGGGKDGWMGAYVC